MEELSFFVGRYVIAAKNRFFSRHLSKILRLCKVEVEDLRVIIEEIRGRIEEIAISTYGPWFLFNLFRTCEASGLEREIEDLFEQILNNDVVLHNTGFRCLLNLLPMCPWKRVQVLHLITSQVCNLLSIYGEIVPIFDHLFTIYTSKDMEVVFSEIATHFLQLSIHPLAFDNLSTLVASYGLDLANAFKHDLWCLFPNHRACVLFRMFLKNSEDCGGSVIMSKLISHFAFLSQTSYSNYFVQDLFSSASEYWCVRISQELDADMSLLVTHRYANYVVQKLIKRFNKEDWQLPPHLLSIIISKRAILKVDWCGQNVLITFDKTRKR